MELCNFQINVILGDFIFMVIVISGVIFIGGVLGGGNSGGGSVIFSGSVVLVNNFQNIGVVFKLLVYSGIENVIKVMFLFYGKVLVLLVIGVIMVVDILDLLDKIVVYIDGENKVLLCQIVINVMVLLVSLLYFDEYGINWSVVYNSLNWNFGISNSFMLVLLGFGNFMVGIVGLFKFFGIIVVINVLFEQGKVCCQIIVLVVILNNQFVLVQVVCQISYLQFLQMLIVVQVGIIIILILGVVMVGFNMSILLYVLINGMVMLQFFIDIFILCGIWQIESNGSCIEFLEFDICNFLQCVVMKFNEMFIISGFEQIDDNFDFKGVGMFRNFLFGGGVNGQNNKEIIVVFIMLVVMVVI